jgi:hypothetical protein
MKATNKAAQDYALKVKQYKMPLYLIIKIKAQTGSIHCHKCTSVNNTFFKKY